jgi:hypothetical protein
MRNKKYVEICKKIKYRKKIENIRKGKYEKTNK